MNTASAVEKIACDMFEILAHTFPVACASDEFFYFPQVPPTPPRWGTWDSFSAGTVAGIERRLSAWEEELMILSLQQPDSEVQIDLSLLQKLACTLREQLSEVRTWEFQPTFYLTLVCLGLAEAIASEEPAAKHERARGLPDFLEQAAGNLNRVPVLFRDMGLEMVAETRNYLAFLGETLPELEPAFAALDRFAEALQRVTTRQDFRLPGEMFERVVRFHLDCGMDIAEADQVLEREIAEMQQVLYQEAGKLAPDSFKVQGSHPFWWEALKNIPVPVAEKGGLIELYRSEVNNLARHCLEKGLVSSGLVSSCPVNVASMPAFLSVIRTASSYSIASEHPPSRGDFYIHDNDVTRKAQKEYNREYRMLTAHETYPGHHLLDAARWDLPRGWLRAVEQPIYYEGWACFAEEIMRLTGYFSGPGDRFLLAKRRLWRAIRGKVDIGLQTGTMSIADAARYLKESGISWKQARSSVRKYALNPGPTGPSRMG